MYINITPRWRENELSVKQFQWLDKDKKKTYVEDLLKLDPKNLSFNDEYILHFYFSKPVEKQKNFITLDLD